MAFLPPVARLTAVLLGIALALRANHAFSPTTALAPSSSTLALRPSLIVVRSVEATAAPSSTKEEDEVKVDGRSLLDGTNRSENQTILRRIFQRRSGGAAIRGDRYGSSNNSTILVLAPSDAAIKVGVKPTLEATKETWQRAWRLHRFMMKILHRFDGCQPKDSKLALACLWWKALAGNDSTSPVYDYQLSYDLLPPITRWIVCRRLCRLYPRLHHANVEIRTAYLDKSVSDVINTILSNNPTNATDTIQRKKIRLIVMGGGYDTRSMKLLERSLLQNENTPHHDLLQRKRQSRHQRWWWKSLRRKKVQTPNNNAFDNITSDQYDLECYELDLPEVVHAKRKLLQSRLFRRRPWLKDAVGDEYPKLIPVNFNNLNDTQRSLEEIILGSCDNNNIEDGDAVSSVENIILFEGVMIYLDEGIPHSLLELCSNVLNKQNNPSSSLGTATSTTKSASGYLCFADRLENIPGGDKDAALIEMESTGWELLDWLSKPGLARHMGVARLASDQ